LESNEQRCFLEELPSDTIVEGQSCSAFQRSRRGEIGLTEQAPLCFRPL
jgi:hypothetical protein